MKITRETEYAFRCVSFLSSQPDMIRSVEEIAAATEIPPMFLAKILQKLQRGKIVRSFRGILGGFSLIQNPEQITMLQVLKAMGDPLAFNDCVIAPDSCSRSGVCLLHPVWKEIRRVVENMLGQATIAPREPGRAKVEPTLPTASPRNSGKAVNIRLPAIRKKKPVA